MQVLTITNMYPPHHYGGYELTCRDVMERWRERGHDVTVLTTDVRVAGAPWSPGDDGGIEVRRELRFYWRDHELLRPSPVSRLAIERANQRALGRVLASARPDVVSVWHMGVLSMSLLTTIADRGVPAVYVVCDDWLDYGPRTDPWMRLWTERPRLARLVQRVTGVPTAMPELADAVACFVSEAVRLRAPQGVPWRPGREVVVPSGIDHRDFPPQDEAGNRPWQWRLLDVGRLDPRKGIDVAIRALTHLPEEATLQVVGRGDQHYEQRLRVLTDELSLSDRVSFAVRPRAELGAVYQKADVLVFPVTWDEPFGLVPLEAMACAVPVVATGTGGSGEFLADGVNCLLHRLGDAEDLAACVRRLAEDAGLRRRLVQGGLATAGAFGIDRYAETLEAWHAAAAQRFRHGIPGVPPGGPALPDLHDSA